MREILFRGKDTTSGVFVYGDLVRGVRKQKGLAFIWSEDDLSPLYIYEHNVDPETVGQFTGMTDKNGKKIFEGDIIHAHYANAPKADFVEQVVFCDGRFCSLFSTIDGSGKMWSALPFSAPHIKKDKSIYMEWCEVIGNIHDNPELLEV